MLQEYIGELMRQYDELAADPFGNKARLSIRREIESAKCMIQDNEMTNSWQGLNRVFGIEESQRPGLRVQEVSLEEDESYQAKFEEAV